MTITHITLLATLYNRPRATLRGFRGPSWDKEARNCCRQAWIPVTNRLNSFVRCKLNLASWNILGTETTLDMQPINEHYPLQGEGSYAKEAHSMFLQNTSRKEEVENGIFDEYSGSFDNNWIYNWQRDEILLNKKLERCTFFTINDYTINF